LGLRALLRREGFSEEAAERHGEQGADLARADRIWTAGA
jgi:hypothetical protein